MLSIDPAALAEVLARMPLHGGDGTQDRVQGHGFFGAGFLFIGSLLVVETLAGGVWRRNRLRTMLWPASLIAAGLGMLIVSYAQPTEKSLHLTLAVILLIGGYFEARYRLGQVPRTAADMVAVPALVLAGIVVGPMHANGPMSSTSAQMHVLVGLAAFVLAGVRLTQLRYGRTLSLDATFGAGVMMMGLSLLLVQQFHAGH
jgi:hypothetical protein